MLTLSLAAVAALSPAPQEPASRPTSQPTSRPTDAERVMKAAWPDDAPGVQVAKDRSSGRALMWRPMVGGNYSTAAEVREKQRATDADLVIGLVIDGQAFAYPINMLGGPQREIVNDTHAGVPYCVNW